jgi:hypothetical protein
MEKRFFKKKHIRKSVSVNYDSRFKFRRFDQYEINQIKIIQRLWRKYFYLIVNNKIIFIQKIIKGWFVRRLINNIIKEIEKLDKFCIIIKITVLYHAIHFNYYKARRSDYNNNHRHYNYNTYNRRDYNDDRFNNSTYQRRQKNFFVERGKPNIINKRRGFRGKRGYY